MKSTLLRVSKMIAIGDRKATIAIAIGDLFSNGDRDRDRDLKFDQDRDRNRNFRDRGYALVITQAGLHEHNCFNQTVYHNFFFCIPNTFKSGCSLYTFLESPLKEQAGGWGQFGFHAMQS